MGSHADNNNGQKSQISNSSLRKKIQVVDFEDVFSVQKEKDFITTNKKNLSLLSKKADMNPLDPQPKTSDKPKPMKQYLIQSPINREKQKLQLQLDNIKKIIMSNPYKHSNYMEHNSALIPEKLINRNIVEPTPIFDEEEDDVSGDKQGFMITEVKKQEGKQAKKHQAMIKQYQVYKNQGKYPSKIEVKMPLGFKEKLEILQEEQEIFGNEVIEGISPINKHLKQQAIYSDQGSDSENSNNQKLLNPKYSQKVSFKGNSISILDPSVQQLQTIQFPELTGALNSKRQQSLSYVPDILKQYLHKKNSLEFVQTIHALSKKRYHKNQNTLDQRLDETLNHSNDLLKHAKEVIQEAQKASTTNLSLLKLSKDLKTQLIQTSPSNLTLNRNIFERFEDFKLQSRLNKFQVEDLYIKREGNQIETSMLMDQLSNSKKGLLVTQKDAGHKLPNLKESRRSLSVESQGHKYKTQAHNSPDKKVIPQQVTDEADLIQQIDIFNLNSNINKFSYQQVQNQKELRELKVQQSRFKTLEVQQKHKQIQEKIDKFKDDKIRKEQSLKEIREGVKISRQDQHIEGSNVIKLPLLQRKQKSPLQLRNFNQYNYNSMKNKKNMKDQSTDIQIVNSVRKVIDNSQVNIRQNSLNKWESNQNSNEQINQ